jgi:hypothetical protein
VAESMEQIECSGGVGLGGGQRVVPSGWIFAGALSEVFGAGEIGQSCGAVILEELRDPQIEKRDVGVGKLLRQLAKALVGDEVIALCVSGEGGSKLGRSRLIGRKGSAQG